MRLLSKILAGAAGAATVVALTGAPAFADPPLGTTPPVTAAVSTGSNTTQNLLDQIGFNWDKTSQGKKAPLYSWDAVNPYTLAIGDNIVTKKGCTAIARPDGSGAGKTALEANTTVPGNSKYYCQDYARSSSARGSSDPACASGGICFVSLAGDAVTWAARDAASGGTDAPKSLTPAQLVKIYECKDTNWKQVGGTSAPIQAYLPQTSSGTRSFWLTALGGGTTPITPGSCVSDLPTTQEPGGTLEENEGINAVYNSPEAIGIFSIGSFVAQAYHSAPCTKADCSEVSATQFPCAPTASQNKFGCDESGYLGLGEISSVKPLTAAKVPTINASFPIVYQRTLFDIVRYDGSTADHIPGPDAVSSGTNGSINLEQLFSASNAAVPGYACKDEAGVIKDYGYLPTWKLSSCGAVG
jgi:ABC-type phosphate transport system substrate-binding protein